MEYTDGFSFNALTRVAKPEPTLPKPTRTSTHTNTGTPTSLRVLSFPATSSTVTAWTFWG